MDEDLIPLKTKTPPETEFSSKSKNNEVPNQIEQKFDLEINVEDDFELNLNEKESKNLISRLNQGASDKAKNFAAESINFYDEMKKKEKEYKRI